MRFGEPRRDRPFARSRCAPPCPTIRLIGRYGDEWEIEMNSRSGGVGIIGVIVIVVVILWLVGVIKL